MKNASYNHHHYRQERQVLHVVQEQRQEQRKEFKMHFLSIAIFIVLAVIAAYLATFNAAEVASVLEAVRDTCVAAAVGVLGDMLSHL